MMSQHTDNPVRHLVVVGGGAAGWLSAAIIAAEHAIKASDHLTITLVESPDVKILGVGEGTWPTMRDTLRKIGINELEFLACCDASFKQGTCFNQWVTGKPDDRYYHPFSLPAGYFEADTTAWWLANSQHENFADVLSTQSALCEAHKAPKQWQTPPYAAVANYGYHLNANKFAELLKRHCVENLGVKHVIAHVDSVCGDDNGDITSLRTSELGDIRGDLFIDCTGFSARLIGDHCGVPLSPVSDVLMNDTALAVQAEYVSADTPVASATHSTAQEAGWVWDIALPTRKGVGYVYSSQHTDETRARDVLLTYLRNDNTSALVNEDTIRRISYTPGYRKVLWKNNVVAIGTSAGFLEPLEASALVMIELSAQMVAKQLPASRGAMQAVSSHFNQVFSDRWQRIIDFLKLHYVLSQRSDSSYWEAMREPSTMSAQLNDWLTQWKDRPPHTSDFRFSDEIFPTASYLFVLYGMGFSTHLNQHQYHAHRLAAAKPFVEQNQQLKQKQLQGLPTNREWLSRLNAQSPVNH